MELVLVAIILALLVDRAWLLWRHSKDQERQGAFDESVVEVIDRIHERGVKQLSEEWTRIQRPEIARPDIHPDLPTPEPIEPDEYENVGTVIPGELEQNGDGD